MRHAAFQMILLGLFISCGQQDTTIVKSQRDSGGRKTDRQVLIEELKTLQSVFASNDKEKIADLFSFPVSNESVSIYIDDSLYNAQYEQNGDKVSRSMFLNHYDEISENLQINELNQLFQQLEIEKLLKEDTLKREIIIKTEPCYSYYGATIENDHVTLTLGTNSNENFKGKKILGDEIPENDSAICEHVLWWVFTFDGKRLRLKTISAAG